VSTSDRNRFSSSRVRISLNNFGLDSYIGSSFPNSSQIWSFNFICLYFGCLFVLLFSWIFNKLGLKRLPLAELLQVLLTVWSFFLFFFVGWLSLFYLFNVVELKHVWSLTGRIILYFFLNKYQILLKSKSS